jgi:uncharacterized membrane protein YhaH (DUF805 family)
MHWMLMPLRRYAEFSGRSRRKEYWMFALLNVLISVFVGMVTLVMAVSVSSESAMMAVVTPVLILWFLLSLAFIIPGLAVTIRRLHDTDRSGWNILWGLIPLIGAIMLLVFYFTDGTPGPNRFGPDPKGEGPLPV